MPLLQRSQSKTTCLPVTVPLVRSACRSACQRLSPDLYFASHFLPKEKRDRLHVIVAVYDTLRQIICADNTDDAEDSTNCISCSQGVIGERKSVCNAIIDSLYSSQPTGKPELDGFLATGLSQSVPKELFSDFIDGAAQMWPAKRYATWHRLRSHLTATAGSIGMAIAHALLDADRARSLQNGPARDQAIAISVAMAWTRILNNVSTDWKLNRLLIPLEDLSRHSLSENNIRQLDPRATPDDRWTQFLRNECNRARNLLRGGTHVQTSIQDASIKRFLAVLGSLQFGYLDLLEKRGRKPFGNPVTMNTWHRLRCVPRAVSFRKKQRGGNKLVEHELI